MPLPDFAVYLKGFAKFGNNVDSMQGHIWLDAKIPFEAIFFSFDPQLSKNVSAKILPEGLKILKQKGYSDSDVDLIEIGLQQKLMRREVIHEVEN